MKKLFLIAAIGGIAFQANAQKIPASAVPAASKAAFAKAYPHVKAAFWEKENGNYEGNWKEGGYDHSAMFTPEGQFAGSETDINPARLPKAAKEYVSKNLHAKIKEASLNKDASGAVTYEADLKGKAYIFDTHGNFIRVGEGD